MEIKAPPIQRPRKHPSHYYKNRGTEDHMVDALRYSLLNEKPSRRSGEYALAFVLAAILSLALAVMIAVKYAN